MKLKLNKKRKVKRTINGQTFSLIPYIDMDQKRLIIDKLIQYFNEDDGKDYERLIMETRANLDVFVIKLLTDIEVDEETDYELMLISGLIDTIRKSVVNYNEVYQDVFYILQTKKLGELLPSDNSISELFTEIPKLFENMSSEQKENLNAVVGASLANSMSNTVIKNLKDDK